MIDISRLKNCGVMIIMAGMPRSGSTWQYEMVKSVLKTLKISIHHGYWDYARHIRMNNSDSRSYYRNEYKKWSTLDNKSVLLYKTHEYKPELLSVCKKNIIFTSHRCLEDELGSMYTSWHIGMKSLNITYQLVKEYDMWRKHYTFDIDYDVAKTQPERTIRLIGEWLMFNMNLSVGYLRFKPVLVEANAGIPSSKSQAWPNNFHTFKHPTLKFCEYPPV